MDDKHLVTVTNIQFEESSDVYVYITPDCYYDEHIEVEVKLNSYIHYMCDKVSPSLPVMLDAESVS